MHLLYMPQLPFYAGEDVIFPVYLSLSSSIVTTLFTLTGNQHLSTNNSQVEVIKQPSSVVLTEGLVTSYYNKVDKIQQWKFVD